MLLINVFLPSLRIVLFSEEVYLVDRQCCCHCALTSSALQGFKACFHLTIVIVLTVMVKGIFPLKSNNHCFPSEFCFHQKKKYI